MQVGGSGERSPPGKQGGFEGGAGPPNGGSSLQRGGMRGGRYMRIPSRVIPRDDVIPDDCLEDVLGKYHVFRRLKKGVDIILTIFVRRCGRGST